MSLEPYFPIIASAGAGLFLGWLITQLVHKARHAAVAERLRGEERRAEELAARLLESQQGEQRAAAETGALRTELAEHKTRLAEEMRNAA